MAWLARLALFLLPLAVHSKSHVTPVNATCTGGSPKAASWVIQDFAADTQTKFDFGPGTVGKVSFAITNKVNGYSFNCLQGDGDTGRVANRYVVDGKVWYNCNVYCKGAKGQPNESDPLLDTSFHFDVKTKALSISQTWGCGAGNSSASTNYTGTGSSVISNLTCSQVAGGRLDEVSCAPANLTIQASNVSLAVTRSSDDQDQTGDDGGYALSNPFVPEVYPKPAVLPGTPGCSKMSQNAAFKITNFYGSGGGISFTLTNTALSYSQRCSIRGISQSVEGRLQTPEWFNCTRFDPLHVNYLANGIYTSLLFGGAKNILGINQTWYCDDDGASLPMVHSVYGEANFPLKCNETRYCPAADGEYRDKPEMVVNDFCSADNTTIAATKTSTLSISKDRALDEFRPHGYNCSAKSIAAAGTQAWAINSFTLARRYVPADPLENLTATYTDELEFWYNNTATDNEWPRNTGWRQCLYLTDEKDQELDGTKQLQCMMSFEPFRLGFKYDNKTSSLALSQVWTCDGIDTGYTNVFSATGTGQVSLNCTTTKNVIKCAAEKAVRVPIAAIASQLDSNDTAGVFSYPLGQ